MEQLICDVDALEAVIGKTPPPMQNKVIDFLDEGSLRWVAATPVVFITLGQPGRVSTTIAGGAPGFARGDARHLRLRQSDLDDPELAEPGSAFASLWLLPQIREGLRINGVVSRIEGYDVVVEVRECYGHCGKALIRSEFWAAEPLPSAPADVADFARACGFMILSSIDAEGRSDTSPKGDPPGELVQVQGAELWFADRPGNKRVDSFRNILTQPEVSALLVVPGSHRVGVWRGRAAMVTDPDSRARFVVQDRTPALVTCVEGGPLALRDSTALQRANLWPVAEAPAGIDSLKILMAHSQHNQSKVARVVTNGVMSVATEVVRKGLEDHYKKTLY